MSTALAGRESRASSTGRPMQHLLADLYEVGVTILSFGAGQDSTAILLLLIYNKEFRAKYAPGRLVVVFSETSDEHVHTQIHLAEIRVLCRKHNIEFHHLTPNDQNYTWVDAKGKTWHGFHSQAWLSLVHQYNANSSIGSAAFGKTCTDNLKIQPIYRFVEWWISKEFKIASGAGKKAMVEYAKTYGRVNVLIGFSAGEETRVAPPDSGHPWMQKSVKRVYPLIDLSLTRQMCQEYIRSVGHVVPYPSNCQRCYFMSKQELLWMFRNIPEVFWEWAMQERAKLEKFAHLGSSNLGVFGKKTLVQTLIRAIREYGHLTDAELDEYKMNHGCVKSKY